MSFTEVMGQMKLSVDKNWHACFVSMAYTDKVKELVKGLFANELLWAIYVWGGGGGGGGHGFHFSIQGSNFVQPLVLIHGE